MKIKSLGGAADTVNSTRPAGCVQPNGGRRPRPLRKRGYYRALARCESWAQMESLQREMMNRLSTMMFKTEIDLYKPSPFIALLDK